MSAPGTTFVTNQKLYGWKLIAVFTVVTMIMTLMVQTGFGAGLNEAEAATTTIIDENGVDDLSGQRDLNQLTVDPGPPLVVGWSWDEIGTSGNNSLDACSLYDTDNDSLANYAICVVGFGNPSAQAPDSPRVYRCNDTRADRCAGSVLIRDGDGGNVPSALTTCTLTSPSGPDPFRGDNSDAVALCTINLDDVGGSSARLLNVCSYSSAQPNSNPSDCVLVPREAFITVAKVASPNDGTNFTFTFNDGVAGTADPVRSINGSGTTGPIAVVSGNTYSIAEAVPPGWNLTNAACANASGTAVGTFDAANDRVTGLPASSSSSITCTFTNALANLTPLADNDSITVDEDSGATDVTATLLDGDFLGDTPTTITNVTDPANGTTTLVGGVVTYAPDANYCDSDSFDYTITDNDGETSTATVTITVACVNDGPVAVDDSYNATEDTPLNGTTVLVNDSDIDGDSLTVNTTPTDDVDNGTLVLAADGTFTYTPDADFCGQDSFIYEISDGNGGTATATVTITVACVNDGPVAVDDSYNATEDTPLNGTTVLVNDSDIDGDSLTVNTTPTDDVDNGTLVLAADGTFTYTPDADFCGQDSFIYEISDGNGGTATATVTITVACVNDGPVAVDDSYNATEDTPLNGTTVLVNDSDIDGDSLTVNTTPTDDVDNGTLVLAADGTFTYTPDADFCGQDSFIYEISDGNGGTATATVTITVACVNDGPVAVDDSYNATEDTPLNGTTVLVNDSDIDGDSLTVNTTPTDDVDNGTLVLAADGTFTYTPDADFCGQDSFIYEISDGNGGTATATVTITVACVNDGPVAVDDSYNATEDTPLNGTTVLVNDSDIDGDSLTVNTTPTDDVDNGTLVLAADGTFTYTPDADFCGQDSFIYEISDGNGGTATATVTITVACVNDGPVAVDDSYNATEDTPLNGTTVLVNDSDIDGDSLTVNTTPTDDVDNGTLVLAADGTFTYTPDADFCGQDSFIYEISDGNGGTATATVTITVACVNDGPVAVDDSYNATEDTPLNGTTVLVNDSDIDGDSLTVNTTPTDDVDNGTLVLAADGTFTYTPDADFCGQDSFIYEISDGNGGTATATVTITVACVNDGPVAVDDSYNATEDTPLNGTTVLVNDSDIDGDSLTVNTTPTDDVDNGTLVLAADGTFTYTPDADFCGQDSFIYEISDGNGGTATATVTITVACVNDGPVAVDDSYNATEDTPLNGTTVLVNDSDIDGDSLTVNTTPTDDVDNGTLVLAADGTFTYTPDADFCGQDSFIYEISDGNGGTATATVTITVACVNDGPDAVDDTGTTDEDTVLIVVAPGVLSNDTDVDGDTLTVTKVNSLATNVGLQVTLLSGALLTVETDGSYSYDPNGQFDYLDDGESTTDSYTYEACDPSGLCDTATVTITVTGVDDPLVALPDTNTVAEGGSLTVVAAAGVLSNDSDPDTSDNPLAVSAVEGLAGNVGVAVDGSTGGEITIASDGSYTFADPDGDFDYLDDGESATTQVSYTVVNQDGATESTTLTITVTGVDDPLVALPDTNTVAEGGSLTVVAAAGVLSNDSDPDTSDNPLAVSAVEGLAGNVGVAVDGSTGGEITIASDGSYTFADPDGDFDYLDDGESATTQVSYTVVNQDGATESTTLTITVTGVDDPLVALPDTNTVAEGGSLTVVAAAGVLSNDSDPDTSDNPLAVSAVEGLAGNVGVAVDGSTGGEITIASDGSYTFADPDGDFDYLDDGESATTQVSYTVVNQDGATESTTLTITVTGVDDPLVALPDTNTVAEGGSLTVVAAAGVLSNDSDPDTSDNPLAVSAVEGLAGNVGVAVDGSTGGEITIASDGSYTFADPDGDFDYLDDGESATTQVSYTVVNQDGATESTTLTITVTGVDDPLVALPDTNTVAEGGSLTVVAAAGVLSNDSDPDTSDNPLAVSAVEGLAGNVGVAVDGSTGGEITIASDGSYTFADPDGDFDYLDDGESATTQVSYTVVNQDGATESTTLTITVTGVDDPLVALPDTNTVAEGGSLTVVAAAGVLSNDSDPDTSDNPLAVSAVEGLAGNVGVAVDGSTGGEITIASDGSYTFADPDGDFDYLDDGESATTQVSYTVVNQDGATESTTLTITVTGVDDPLVALDDVDSTDEDTVLTVAAAAGVLSNDSDPDTTDNPLAVNNINDGTTDYGPGAQITTSGGGLLTVNADGSYSFDPNGAYEYLAVGESTSEQVTYTVVNQDGAEETATLTITITGVNDNPIADNDSYLGLLNTPLTIAATGVLGNDTDVDTTDTLTVASNTDPSNGTVTQNGDGSFTYTPNADFCGTDSYTYTISDGNGGSDTATVTVFVQCPIISIDKQTADDYGNEADGLGVLPGENVTWNYYVSNDGNVVLENVVVVDDKLGTLSGPVTLLGPVSGDDNNDGKLDLDETWLYTATGTAESDWYYNTGTAVADEYSDSAGNTLLPSDSDGSSYYGLMPGVVTNSSLCDFGDQFRLIFTPDMGRYSSSTPYYKLSDSNPGQTYYNVFYVNDGTTDTISMEIPYPYVTQGAMPVHVYGGLTVNPDGSGGTNCFVPTGDGIAYGETFGLGDYTDTNGDGVIGFGDTYLVEVPAEIGFQYVNIHLDYGLEKTDGWLKKGASATSDGTGKNPARSGLSIVDNTAHEFKAYADGVLIDLSADTVYNLNEFKQIRGFGGLVNLTGSLDPVEGAQVQLIGPDGTVLETMTTDSDGWYLSDYVHKGKAKTYTLRLVADTDAGDGLTYSQQEIPGVLVGGKIKFGEGNFLVPATP